MNIADGNRRISSLEAAIAFAVLEGEIAAARSLATNIALVRDSMLTHDELTACAAAR